MCASRWRAIGPQLVVVALIGLGVASCSSNSDRFSDIFGPVNDPGSETTGSIPPSTSRVDSKPLPHLASNSGEGVSGGGRGMGSYQPANSDVTGSLPHAAPPPPAWTWEGGTAVTLAPGETLEMLAKRHGVPARRPHGSKQHHQSGTGPCGTASGHSALSGSSHRRFGTADAHRLVGTFSRAARSAAKGAGADRRRPRCGARRDPPQHRAALSQAGSGAGEGQ